MEIGDQAPEFVVPDQSGQMRSLAEFRGRPLVLFFYPRASTSGCTVEAQGFRDAAARFERAGVALVGASPDTVAAQKKFAENERLPFPLLADAEKQLCQAYGVLGEKSLYGHKYIGVVRTTVLIAADGRVARVWAPVKPVGHAAEVLAALRADGAPRVAAPAKPRGQKSQRGKA
ncbi:MAG: thioredoxin-dependent thiol peroxidase [Terriglobales bacterium]